MKYFIFDNHTETKAINGTICAGESIGDATNDETKKYFNGLDMLNGKVAFKADAISSKYITDRDAVELTDNDFPQQNKLPNY